MKLFLQKKCKIFERWGLRPHTPVPPAAGGFAPKPPASGGWGLRPQTPIGLRRLGAPPPDPQNSPPHCEFLATRLDKCTQTSKNYSEKEVQGSVGVKINRYEQRLCNVTEFEFASVRAFVKHFRALVNVGA